MPVKLFFDIEFYLALNKGKSQTMLKYLLNLIVRHLGSRYDVKCSIDDILILDSCTSLKFSYHLILPKVIVANIKCCKSFIMSFLSSMSTSDKEFLLVRSPSGGFKSVIDLAVYSKNQNMRILLSSKFGKDCPLRVSDENRYYFSRTETGMRSRLYLKGFDSVRLCIEMYKNV